MHTNTKPPPAVGSLGGSEFGCSLAGSTETENGDQGGAAQAAIAAEPVTIADINSKVAEVNFAISRAADAAGEANWLIGEANDLIDEWSRRHPGQWMEPIDEIDEPEDIDEVDGDDDDFEGGEGP
jgi:hypothetical protein